MAPPPQKECPVVSCDYKTPATLPNYELVYRDLDMHTRYHHINLVPPATSPSLPSLDISLLLVVTTAVGQTMGWIATLLMGDILSVGHIREVGDSTTHPSHLCASSARTL